MPDLLGLLSDNKITLRSLRAGHTEQVLCPDCQGGRTREKTFTVTIDADGAGFVALCHRGHCGHKMGFRVHDAPAVERQVARQQPKPPPAVSAEAASYRPDWLYDFFAKRNIGAKTVVDLGIYASRHWFGEHVGELPCIVFPYVFKGELVNRKYRPEPGKQPQAQDKGAIQTFYNVDALGESPFEVVWVEGEPDVAAMKECGVIAISLKDGSGTPPKNGAPPPDDDRRFEALRTHEKLLTGVQRFVLAGDNDVPGLWLREELARRLGRHRCVLVTWPEGCKDAGDVLRLHGPDAVLSALAAAEPYPISGLQKAKPGTLRGLRALPPPRTMTTGARATDDILRLPTEGRLIVVDRRAHV